MSEAIFYDVGDGKARYKLYRANTGYIGGSTNIETNRVSGYPVQYPLGTRFFKYPKVRALVTGHSLDP